MTTFLPNNGVIQHISKCVQVQSHHCVQVVVAVLVHERRALVLESALQ